MKRAWGFVGFGFVLLFGFLFNKHSIHEYQQNCDVANWIFKETNQKTVIHSSEANNGHTFLGDKYSVFQSKLAENSLFFKCLRSKSEYQN